MNLHRLDIATLHRAYRGGDALPSAALAHALARIDASELDAVADLDRAGAAAAAAESDRRVHAGALRPLEGVTVGVKSNIAVAGLPWTAGLAARRARVADRDAAVVARLRDAGAIVVGTLGMHEAALGATSDNAHYGRIRNPHDPERTPGGSSGGSGAAVAAGLVQLALGTDTLGSVRIPAAYNGVYGLKPTNGAVDDDGLVACEPGLDAIGPLARSLGDLAVVWGVIAPGPHPDPPHSPLRGGGGNPRAARAPLPPGERSEPRVGRVGVGAAGYRIVTLADLGPVEAAVGVAYERALAALAGPPATLALADPLPAIRLAGFVAAGRALAADLGPEPAGLSPELAYMLDFCARATPQPEVLARTRAALVAALGDDGVLLTPTAPQAAFAHGRAPVTQADFTGLANIAGLPALSIPAGRDSDGMPVAVQLIGPAGSEAALLELGGTLDAALGGYAPPPGF